MSRELEIEGSQEHRLHMRFPREKQLCAILGILCPVGLLMWEENSWSNVQGQRQQGKTNR